jgi:hypothetical protein
MKSGNISIIETILENTRGSSLYEEVLLITKKERAMHVANIIRTGSMDSLSRVSSVAPEWRNAIWGAIRKKYRETKSRLNIRPDHNMTVATFVKTHPVVSEEAAAMLFLGRYGSSGSDTSEANELHSEIICNSNEMRPYVWERLSKASVYWVFEKCPAYLKILLSPNVLEYKGEAWELYKKSHHGLDISLLELINKSGEYRLEAIELAVTTCTTPDDFMKLMKNVLPKIESDKKALDVFWKQASKLSFSRG